MKFTDSIAGELERAAPGLHEHDYRALAHGVIEEARRTVTQKKADEEMREVTPDDDFADVYLA